VFEHTDPVALTAEGSDQVFDQRGLAGIGMPDERDYWIHRFTYFLEKYSSINLK
jgi:hypothetical protein